MGFKRFMKKNLIPFYNTRDMIDKVQTYGFVDGIKEKMREDFLEDTPISSHIYNAGKHEGKKDGYKKASIEYEKKLLAQANAFLNQMPSSTKCLPQPKGNIRKSKAKI
ncbi:hypothetical protein [Bacillus mobilis]|uniref:hypothetical protein n=1 Tax=Bacillus mobilis TaxID=2026190 RepID=UPI00367D8BFF